MERKWWKEMVAYQVYPRSFMDSNGDGIGDIQGIVQKLDYLADLGIDLIWISPIYQSPNDDNGYDISDYKAILADFGTMEDFDLLLEEVHRRGMKLIMDLVINHTSDEHHWFVESRSSKENPYRDYYIWREGENGKEPNNWESIFSGSAWQFDEQTGEYYLHVFSKKQPDLNWENPVVRNELYNMVNWWLDKGIDGFRVDAISHIKKREGFPDMPNPQNDKYVSSFDMHMNQPGIQEFLKELKEETFEKYDIVTVGEANGVDANHADEWVGSENGKFNMIFQFEHLDLWAKDKNKGIDLPQLKETLTRWQKALDGSGWNALFMENHDQPRAISSWGDSVNYHQESAKAIATLYFLMQGTPFIYQGQEIGMTNVKFPSITDYDDVRMRNFYHYEREAGRPEEEIMEIIWQTSRDNSRTPMQWDDSKNAGFTEGTPWIGVNPNYKAINVEEAIKNPTSIFHYYKQLIQLRKENDVLIYGTYDLALKEHDRIFAYTRRLEDSLVLVLVNMFAEETAFNLDESLDISNAELLLSNYENLTENKMQPYETRVYRIK
ncbi:alpha-glucosidase [Oceanobacillus sp. FSL H7-0719]|uniref:glycoside hydrolase family 13 protein n=1 Tax=Oceanobacillus sp. FSL H7-0719 TaxID=2954507 RepID=UPI0032528C2C